MLHVVRKCKSGAQAGLRLVAVTESPAQLIIRNFNQAPLRKKIRNTAPKLAAIGISRDSCASKPVVSRVVVHLEIGGRRSARRKPHRRYDRRKAPDAIQECKSCDVENRSKHIAFA